MGWKLEQDGQPVPCEGATDLFYGPESDLRLEPKEEKEAREAVAKEVCEGCELRWECLSGILLWESHQEDKEERFGVWGSMSPGDRREFVRWMKERLGRLWREGFDDFDYLEEQAVHFLAVRRLEREEREEAKQEAAEARSRQQDGAGRAPRVMPVVVGSKRDKSAGARPVDSGNGDRRGAGRRSSASPSKGQDGGRSLPKAASAGGVPTRPRKVRG